MKKVILLSGIPGSGKTYWAKNECALSKNIVYISRDQIRFSMLKDGDEYFSKENLVFKEFIAQANAAINDLNIDEVILDATHLNWVSRRKTLNHLNLNECEVIIVAFDTPLEECWKRNDKREGRARVPKEVIQRMFYQKTDPNTDPYEYKCVRTIKFKSEVK